MTARLRLLPALLLPLLGGCHADVTTRFDVRGDGTTLVTAKEIIDDELYKLALSQDPSGDPFFTEKMRRDGWLISRDTDKDGNHVMTISKLMKRKDYGNVNHLTPIVGGMPQSLGSVRFARAEGLFFERDSISATVAPLMPLVSSNFGRFYAGIASELLSSVIALHLEMKSPGKLLATNGKILSDGAVRWNLNLEEPTTIEYSARTIDLSHVALGSFIALIAGLAITAARVRRSARGRSESESASVRSE